MILKDLLKGFTAHIPQSIGNMSVIPLTAPDSEYHDVGDVSDIDLDRDTDYNSLHLRTRRSSGVTIVPNGLTYITKEHAQDRAIHSAHLIKDTKEMGAFCVQSSQCGYMSGQQRESRRLRLLPQSLRFKAYQKRGSSSYSELWQSLAAFNRSMNLSGDFLATYFDKFADQLDQFVAEFEVIPQQRGAIILINDEVIGVEVAPNEHAFEAIWEPAIRDCYGSEALRARDKAKPAKEEILEDIDNLDDLAMVVDQLGQREKARAQKIIMSILDQSGKLKKNHTLDELTMYNVETSSFVGFGVKTEDEDDGFIFLSLISKPMAQRGFEFN